MTTDQPPSPPSPPSTNNHHQQCVCHVKPEYVLPKTVAPPTPTANDDDAATTTQPSQKRERGINTNRQFGYDRDATRLCPRVAMQLSCTRGDQCKSSHDLSKYMSEKRPDVGGECVNFQSKGYCPFGVRCRFHQQHTVVDDGNEFGYRQLTKDTDVSLQQRLDQASEDRLWDQGFGVRLRKRTMAFPKTDAYFDALQSPFDVDQVLPVGNSKHRIDWEGKLYLAPLTTVGNLPFRRLCKSLGVDVTCSEMAMSLPLLQGSRSEWALLKRHPSEDIFGIQLAGKDARQLAQCVELINEHASCDFIDLNMGCPIDLVFNKGMGSGLFQRPRKMYAALHAMSSISDCEVTCKFRTGIQSDRPVAHTHLSAFKHVGMSMCALHGRTRAQRYTKLANWDYIHQCARQAHELELPFYGNGDVLSYEDLDRHLKSAESALSGLMIGRGALIKPWIFTELKERRHWDISSSERLDLMKRFAAYGMEHWGSDSEGIAKTRRFLLEWWSFAYRYVPVGLLERVPQGMNEKPPRYRGRDDLETLMASDHVNDWIKLTEMVLGPAGEFSFTPKHKSNAYPTEAQG